MLPDFLIRWKAAHSIHQQQWEQWTEKFIDSYPGNRAETFWYLSSGLDFFPLQKFSRHTQPKNGVDFFLFSDYAPLAAALEKLFFTSSGRSAVPAEGNQLYLQTFIRLTAEEFSFPATFMLLQDAATSEALVPLMLLECSNDEALQKFLRHQIEFRYLATVADGCRPAGGKENPPCPVEHYRKYQQVIPDGYWLSDHLPEAAKRVFSLQASVEHWGRYNVNMETGCYKIDF
jgi:hypothetical protein